MPIFETCLAGSAIVIRTLLATTSLAMRRPGFWRDGYEITGLVRNEIASGVGQTACTSFGARDLFPSGSGRYIDLVKTNLHTTVPRPTESTSFRLLLQAELGRRCARNPQYSLRAFAKFLAIDHATLSQLMRGKRALTGRTLIRLGSRLGLERPAIDVYLAQEAIWGRSREDVESVNELRQLATDTASVISEWHHYAILELTRLRDFKPDSRWIAQVLGITPDLVNLALSRLLRLGLLEMVDRHRWVDRSGDTTTSLAEFGQAAVRQLSQQVHQLMLTAFDRAPVDRYEHRSTTLAVSTELVPGVLECIARFHRELIERLEQDQAPDDVYRLEISFFPVTTLQRDEENARGTTRDAVADFGEGPR
jgi:uncharacterized protein (TIGR02147 family)